MNDEKLTRLAKTARLATNEAKTSIMAWASRFDEDDEQLAVAVISSVYVAKDMIDAVLTLGDEAAMQKTLRQIDDTLTPFIATLREAVAKQTKQ